MERRLVGRCHAKIWFIFFASFLLGLFMSFLVDLSSFVSFENSVNSLKTGNFFTGFGKKSNSLPLNTSEAVTNLEYSEECSGRYIYVHELPSKFNDDVIKDCHTLFKYSDWCPDMENSGLGRRVGDSQGLFSSRNWFSTNQFLLELIFRSRMNQYPCLTKNSSQASAIYVPVYIGLDVGRYLWEDEPSPARDSLSLDLLEWLRNKPEWKRMWGRDHFFVAGRISWDLRRKPGDKNGWGSSLMSLPEAKNMTMLTIEGTSWSNDFAIPYPTFFHPEIDEEVWNWQRKLRKQRRSKLFTFVGAPRPKQRDSIRWELISQCRAANKTCRLLNCEPALKCNDPMIVMKTFLDSVFCLQPPGDSFTRRSIFDSILAGCIPVFFHPASAYLQYVWHFPGNHSSYSVFIPARSVREGNVSVEETLMRIPQKEVLEMRENVIRMIPKIVYANPNSGRRVGMMQDAFDVAVKGVLDRVEDVRRDMREGKDCGPFDNWAPHYIP